MRLVLFGYGFLGRAVARRALAEGWSAAAIVRGEDGADLARSDGVVPLPLADRATSRDAAEAADALLVTAPPGEDGCPGLAALDGALPGRWVGYLSTTGVYGDHAGGWVFEETALTPKSAEARRRVAAEAAWGAASDALRIFRLPGLYGAGRSAFDRLREGTARRIVRPGQLFSRLHIDDGAVAILAAMSGRGSPGAYNLCDDLPAPNADVIAHAAGLIGLPVPPAEDFETADLSPASRRFYGESKRVSNARAKAALDWRPALPTYREGLAAILAAGG